jgi:hypothetical protein
MPKDIFGQEVPLKFEELSDYGDLMTIAEFMGAVVSGGLIDYDGNGVLVKDDQESNQFISPSNAQVILYENQWATHVMWFNK